MSAVTVDLAQLDANTSRTDATAQRTRGILDRCQAVTSACLWFVIVLAYVWRVRSALSWIRRQIAKLEIESQEHRTQVQAIATKLGRLAQRLEEAHQKCVTEVVPKLRNIAPVLPFVSTLWALIGRLLEELACRAEDAAETLALAGSKPFAELVARELADAHSGSCQQPSSDAGPATHDGQA